MNFKYFIRGFLIRLFSSRKQKTHLTKIEAKKFEINDTLSENEAVEACIKPYREHIDKDLDSI